MLIEGLRKKKRDAVSVEEVLELANQLLVSEVDTEFQNHQTLMNKSFFAACCLHLVEVKILLSHVAVMDSLDEDIAAQVSRQPAWHLQAC